MKNTEDKNEKKTSKIVFILLAMCIILALFASYQLGVQLTNDSQPKVTVFKEFFSDIDGDGDQDLIKYAEVVINNSNVDFNQAQP